MNWIDRAVGYVAPTRGLARARARAALRVVRSYDAAKTTRATEGWITSGTSANAELAGSLETIRNRGRDLVRNNGNAFRALDHLVNSVVGTGIIAQSKTGKKGKDARLDELWRRHVDECDADEDLDFYGLQALIARTTFESGECLTRIRRRRPEDGLAVPLQYQVLEPDHIDSSKNGVNGTNVVVQGVEYDALGKRLAYWLFPTHPGDTTIGAGRSWQSVRTPASSIVHTFRKLRPGQGRGVSIFAPSMVKARDLDELLDAALVRRKIEACLAAFRVTPDGSDATPIGVEARSAGGAIVEQFEPGMIVPLGPGEDIRISEPTSGGGLVEHAILELHALAAGIGVTYQAMTGDLRQTNYSSYRAGNINFQRLVETLQWLLFIPRVCQRLRREFVDAAAISEPALEGAYATEWNAPRFESIDPEKDARADLLEVRAGFQLWDHAVARRGEDPDKQLAAIKARNAALDAADVVLDSDPRRVTGAGLAQASDPTPNADAGGQGDQGDTIGK